MVKMKTCLTYAEVMETLMSQTEKNISITNVFGATPEDAIKSGLEPHLITGYWKITYTDWNSVQN